MILNRETRMFLVKCPIYGSFLSTTAEYSVSRATYGQGLSFDIVSLWTVT